MLSPTCPDEADSNTLPLLKNKECRHDSSKAFMPDSHVTVIPAKSAGGATAAAALDPVKLNHLTAG